MGAEKKLPMPEIVEAYLAGTSMRKLMMHYGTSYARLKRLFRKRKIAIRAQKDAALAREKNARSVYQAPEFYGEHRVKDIVEAYRSGSSTPAVRARFGLSFCYLRKLLRASGVTLRTRSEACVLRDSKLTAQEKYDRGTAARTMRRMIREQNACCAASV
jgi:hypothetical protein